MHGSAAAIRSDVAELLKPPIRIRTSEAAHRYVRVRTSSGGIERWDPKVTPYMVEPMDMVQSRLHHSIIFVGPAQSGKTQALVDGVTGWQIVCAPADMMIVQTSRELARDFSHRRIDRMHRQSPDMRDKIHLNSDIDNVHDKQYRAGTILNVGWPNIKQLSGRPQKFMILSDYDRMPIDVGKEGSVYSQAVKRTTSFLSAGMTIVETSPGYEILEQEKDTELTPHEAPPTRGALALFNLGDRRRWYWKCQACDEYWMQPPGIDGFSFRIRKDPQGVVDSVEGEVGVPCPHCGNLHSHTEKRAMNATGMWVPEHCHIEDGRVVGTPRRSGIASYWLPGAAATYSRWQQIVERYVHGLRVREITGTEEALKGTTLLDLGCPFQSIRRSAKAEVAALKARGEGLGKRVIPDGVRYLTAAIDVQGAAFEVIVVGWGIGQECWIIDRYAIEMSDREIDGEPQGVKPATMIEDWKLLTERVLRRSYPSGDYHVLPAMVACDTGGQPGVSENAYHWWRSLRPTGMHQRAMLVKGTVPRPGTNVATIRVNYPDTSKGGTNRAKRVARGEVPLHSLNTTTLKDDISAGLSRELAGPGYIHIPNWQPDSFFAELLSEDRTPKGWKQRNESAPNDSLDLLVYSRAASRKLGGHEIDWSYPPPYAAPWEHNPLAKRKAEAPQQRKITRSAPSSPGFGSEEWQL